MNSKQKPLYKIECQKSSKRSSVVPKQIMDKPGITYAQNMKSLTKERLKEPQILLKLKRLLRRPDSQQAITV